MTIMRDSSAFLAYPYERLAPETLEALSEHCKTGFEHGAINRLCRTLECFLQVTQQNLSLAQLVSAQSDALLTRFIGSLFSPSFRHLSISRGDSFARVLRDVVNRLRQAFQAAPFLLYECTELRTVDFQRAQVEFEQLPLCEEKVWYWTGWSCVNSTGNIINLPLLSIYQKLGRRFTAQLHALCVSYAISRRAPIVRAITYLSRFVASDTFTFCADTLQERQGSTDFFNTFWRHFYTGCVHAGSKHTYAVASWRNHIVPFIKEQLLPSGLFALPRKIPDPHPAKEHGEDTHVRGLGSERFKDKLLVHVPLQLSDDAAFEVIRDRLYEADRMAIQWCDLKIAATVAAYRRTTELAATGIPIRCEQAPKRSTREGPFSVVDDPFFANNFAATLRVDGFDALLRAKRNHRIISEQKAQTLALPASDTLFPFCLKLIKLHPEITPSFLKSVELYDRKGQMLGKHQGDACTYLHGYKDRKQAANAQMHVKLNAQSEALVSFLVEMTAPLRAYLKTRKDDAWRKLLLTCKGGFGKPCPYACKVNFSAAKLVAVHDELRALHPQSPALIPELAHSLLRPSTMRSTAAVLVFFETSSVYRMAEALGHKTYSADLLLRYLPSSILHFYRDRWVRVFQMGIIIQAMVDSPLLLQATGFDSATTLDAFLEQHVIKLCQPADAQSPMPRSDHVGDKTFICLSLMTLRILLTLHERGKTSPQRLNEKARHWAEFTAYLLTYLESEPDHHLELLAMVQQARALGGVDLQQGVLYEQ